MGQLVMRHLIVLLVMMTLPACAHRHHPHAVTQLVAAHTPDAAVLEVRDASLSDATKTVADGAADTTNDLVKSEINATSSAIVPVYYSNFDITQFDAIANSPIASTDNMPSTTTASLDGFLRLADSIDGAVELTINFGADTATGRIYDMTYFGTGGETALTGQLEMNGGIVSRIGLKLDVDGTVASDLTGQGEISGILRGVLHGNNPHQFAGYLSGSTTLPILGIQSINGPVYAD